MEHNFYALRSPFIRTQRHALEAAEMILNRLNRYRGPIRCADTSRATKSNAILTKHSEALDEIPQTI